MKSCTENRMIGDSDLVIEGLRPPHTMLQIGVDGLKPFATNRIA